MSRDEYYRQQATDLLTLVLLTPFCLWLDWWGILPAFGIGFLVNCFADRIKGNEP